jgi:hypothetical protein
MPDPCDEFVREITKYFNILWEHATPTIVHSEVAVGGRCLVVLEAEGMRFKFHRAPDEVVVQLGASDAPPIWGEQNDEETCWYYLRSIAAFLEKKSEPNWPLPRPWSDYTLELQLDEQAQLLVRHRDEVVRLFAGGGMRDVETGYAAYAQAMSEEVMRRYSALSGDET